jgi:hypothetical protein
VTGGNKITLREAVRLLFWTRRSDDRVFHLRVAGGAVGILVAAIEFPSPQCSFAAAGFAFGILGALLGSGVGVDLMLFGSGREPRS